MLIWVLTLSKLVANYQNLRNVHRVLKLYRTVCDIQNIKLQNALYSTTQWIFWILLKKTENVEYGSH